MARRRLHLRLLVMPVLLLVAQTGLTADGGKKVSSQCTAAVSAAVSTIAHRELEQSGTPSLQVAIGKNGSLIFEGGFGVADVENEVPASALTRYRTASVNKWWTATAAMKLAEQGRLDLDAPVQQYCSQFPTKKWPVTTRQLLTQTSGIRHYRDYDAELAAAKNPQQRQAIELQQLRETVSATTRYTDRVSPLKTFQDDPLEFEPGSGWQYTSFGYRLLGCVLEGAGQQPYTELMASLVLSPAGMSHTVVDDAWALVPHRATGYHLERGGELRRAELRDVSENLPAGGYLSTATDLVKFAMMFNNGLVTAEHRALMATAVSEALDDASEPSWRDAIPQANKYGYGLMLFSKYHPGMIGHTGRQAGGSSIVVLQPDEGLAIAVMTNAKGWNGYLTFMMALYQAATEHCSDS